MRDPISWSLPMGRLSGITIRVHLLFPFVVLALILRAAYEKTAPEGAWIDAAMVLALLFASVLLHELGHCFGARSVEGDATEVLLWPLGGLASVEIPQTPRAHLITAAAGPAVNLILCLICMLLLLGAGDGWLQPPWNPMSYPSRDRSGLVELHLWSGPVATVSTYSLAAALARLFWVNYFLFLINVCLIGYPLDGGRIFQSILWPYLGYRQATLWAVTVGFFVMFIIGVVGIAINEVLLLCLAIFIYAACKHQWLLLENGGDESLFGYDFSQGYTSLERDQPADEPPTRRRKLGWWQRWPQKRAARKIQREMEDREAAEQRFDALLEKISSQGMNALTEEEKRFMKQYSDRYRNRP